MDNELKRNALRDRIGKAEMRLAERSSSGPANELAGAFVDYAKRHPAVVVGGALAVGLLLGSLPRRGSKAATVGFLGRFATDVAIGFALAMLEKASDNGNPGSSGDAQKTN